jgi:fatty acid synthase subunit beta
MAISYQTVDGEGLLHSRKMFPITDSTHSYTYRSPSGLLFATQFTQQALTLMERARFEDMRSRGLIITQSAFAGHSLGEYGALASYSDLMSVEDLVSIVFFRGLTMQAAVERDVSGRSAYSMLAVNPSRVSHKFNEASLQWLISQISQATGCLLEIVNYNITNMQYACAGDVRALEVLGNICSTIKKQGIELPVVTTDTTASPTHSRFVIHKGNADPIVSLINNQAKVTLQRSAPLNGTSIPNIELRRGAATIPLTGIDVPFHSSFLRQGILPFRHFLEKNIDKSAVKPAALVGKWIPNLTGRTFGIMKEDFEEVYRLTQSVVLGDIVKNWARYTGLPEKQKGDCNSQHREQYWLEERL